MTDIDLTFAILRAKVVALGLLRGEAPTLILQFGNRIGKRGELLYGKRFTADVFGKAAGEQDFADFFLAERGKAGGKAVAERLAALGKGCADDLEE